MIDSTEKERKLRMKKCYAYSKLIVIMTYGPVLLVLFIIFFIPLIGLGIPRKNEGLEFFIGIATLGVILCSAVFFWILMTLKIRIYLDDDGITYISLFRKVHMKWQDVLSIERKFIYSGSMFHGSNPRDLEIKDRSDKKIKIFYFVKNCAPHNVEEGIKDFEAEIRKHIGVESVFKG